MDTGKKLCWNHACVCWTNDPDLMNCGAEDFSPDDCKLAEVDLRPALEISKMEDLRERFPEFEELNEFCSNSITEEISISTLEAIHEWFRNRMRIS